MCTIRVRDLQKKARFPIFSLALGILAKELKIMSRYVGSLLIVLFIPFGVSGLYLGVGYALAGEKSSSNFQANTGVATPLAYFVVGGVLMIASMVMIENASSIIREEQLIGTFELHYLTPNSPVLTWMLHAFAWSILMVIVFAIDISIVLATSIVGYDYLTVGMIFLVVFIGLIPLAGLGLVIAALTIRFKEVYAVSGTINAFISMLSGFYYPLEIFPRIVQAVAQLLPTTHVSIITKTLIGASSGQLSVGDRILVMVLLAFLYLTFGKTIYQRWENEARKRGELSKY